MPQPQEVRFNCSKGGSWHCCVCKCIYTYVYKYVCVYIYIHQVIILGQVTWLMGLNPGPLQWKPRILTTGPPGTSPPSDFNVQPD